jgi:hypothetical protein
MNILPERIESFIASSLNIAAQAKELNALREQIKQAQAQMFAPQRSIQKSGPSAMASRPLVHRKPAP